MKRIYIKSVLELGPNFESTKIDEYDYIGDLFLFDLDHKCYYYIFNTTAILEKSKRGLISNRQLDPYTDKALKESYEISEKSFNELLNKPGREFYNIIKNDLLKILKLEELMI